MFMPNLQGREGGRESKFLSFSAFIEGSRPCLNIGNLSNSSEGGSKIEWQICTIYTDRSVSLRFYIRICIGNLIYANKKLPLL